MNQIVIENKKILEIKKEEYYPGHRISFKKEDFSWNLGYIGKIYFYNQLEILNFIEPQLKWSLKPYSFRIKDIDDILLKIVDSYSYENLQKSGLGQKITADLVMHLKRKGISAGAELEIKIIELKKVIKP